MRTAYQVIVSASKVVFPIRWIVQTAGLAVLLLTLTIFSMGATYSVTNTNDSGRGSLRAAVAAANRTLEDDVIEFRVRACPRKACTFILTSGELTVAPVATAGKLVISNATGRSRLRISGNDTSRIFYAVAGSNLTLQGLTLQHGAATEGGAVKNEGTLTIYDSAIEASAATYPNAGGGGGGILTDGGALSIYRSEVRGNRAVWSGGGIYGKDSAILIRDSTIAENVGWWGGGIDFYAWANYQWRADLVNVTLSGNESREPNGALSAGGAIFLENTSVPIYLFNVTVTNNLGDWGGGVAADGLVGGGMAFMNTIIAGNIAQHYPDFGTQGAYQNLGNSILGPSTSLLGPLSENGGSTRTHALLPGSPAIDGGNNCVLVANGCGDGNPALSTDQRGVARVGAVDIGAYEYAPGAVVPRPDTERDR